MKIKQVKLLSSTLITLFSGCASYTWTESQIAQIQNVGVSEVKLNDEAYHSPDPTRSPGMSNSIPQATGGGLIPALIGAAIDASIESKQKKSFENKYSEYVPQIDELYQSFPKDALEENLMEFLEKDEFFASRMSESPETFFKLEIIRIGFVRAIEATNESLHLAYEITARVKLETSSEKILLNKIIDGTSKYSQFADEIANSPELKEKFIEQAVSDFIEKIKLEIDLKLKR